MKKNPPSIHLQDALNRRTFLKQSAAGIGMAALASLLGDGFVNAVGGNTLVSPGGSPLSSMPAGLPHFPAKAKRIIYLFQSGAPSQLDLCDYKPQLQSMRGTDLPASVRMGQRLTGMTSAQKTF